MPSYIVTGTSGTIGTALVLAMQKRGDKVCGVDRRPNEWSNKVERVTVRGDLLVRGVFRKLPKRADAIVHLAANARVFNLVKDPKLALENVTTAFNVFEYARRAGIKRVLFASSRETYGNIDHIPLFHESDARHTSSESTYAASKISGEAFAHAYRVSYGLRTVILRFSNVYGRYDSSDRFVPLVIKRLLNGKAIHIFGAEKELDFTYLDDCVAGVLRVLARFDAVNGETLNLSSGKSFKLANVAHELAKILRTDLRMVIEDNRPGEVLRYRGSIAAAQRIIGYRPQVSIHEGLRKSAEWYRRYYGA